MDKVILELAKRDVTGKAVKRLRAEGQIPAVIHDHGKASIIVMAPYSEIHKVYLQAGKHHPVSLKADGHNYTALIKHATFDPKKNRLTHVVFNAVNANQPVTAEIPVHVVYDEGNDSSPAERAGLIVLHQLEAVEVEALPGDLPDALTFNGEKLVAVGDHATVADLIIPAGVTLKTELEHALATVFEPSALAAANDAAGGDAEDTDASAEETAEAEGEGAAKTSEGGTPEAGKEQKKA
jgi:large subunit ribosomal protein L25